MKLWALWWGKCVDPYLADEKTETKKGQTSPTSRWWSWDSNLSFLNPHLLRGPVLSGHGDRGSRSEQRWHTQAEDIVPGRAVSVGEERIIPTWWFARFSLGKLCQHWSLPRLRLPGAWQLSLPQGYRVMSNLARGPCPPDPLSALCTKFFTGALAKKAWWYCLLLPVKNLFYIKCTNKHVIYRSRQEGGC